MSLTSGKQLILTSGAAGGGGYAVSRSLRFNSSDSAYLSRVPASAGNRKTWTWAGWVKLGAFGTVRQIFTCWISGSAYGIFYIFSNDTLQFDGGPQLNLHVTAAVYRDPSAWYHIQLAIDTADATAANRVRLWVNGALQTWATTTAPTQNNDGTINTANAHRIGSLSVNSEFFNGYLADIHFIDGQALDPTAFGEFDTNGIWQPIEYTGSYGTNGFHLDFADNSSNTATTLGKDTSGAGNNWTPVNLSTTTGGPTSVASASGALPVYNTTDTYGTTKGTGTRTDSNSSSIVLALPMDGTNNGTTFTDESATIKGSGSAKTLTRNGDTKTVTSQSKFYGSSGSFDGTGDYLSHGANTDFAFGTGDLTVELWVYFNSLPGSGVAGLVDTGTSINANRFSVVVYPNGATYVDSNVNLIVGTAGKITTGKWIHLAVCRSGTNATLYINGVADKTSTVSTDFSNDLLRVGATIDNLYLNGYIQDLRIYKGVAKYTGNFNPPSSTQNATIAAGNDSLVDVPTNGAETDTGAGGEVRGNYCTWNAIDKGANVNLANGNLDTSQTAAGIVRGTIGTANGKWYWEYTCAASTSNAIMIGIATAQAGISISSVGGDAYSWGYYGVNGQKYTNNAGASYGASFTTGDVIGVALDADAGTLTFYKNGASQGQAYSGLTSGPYFPAVGTTNQNGSANFGQRTFAYTAPSGFKALCTANLPVVVTKPSDLFDVKLITANNSTQVITGLAFSPDLVWTKSRSNAYSHYLYDTVRGVQKPLISNATNAESTIATSLTSFNSDGFTLGADDGANYSSGSSVAWAWDAGSSTVTNTQGSISSQVRANASAGFSVVTYSFGNAPTVGHGLGVAPSLIIAKSRTVGVDWVVYHRSLGKDKLLVLNGTGAEISSANYWGSSEPSSTVFGTIGNNTNSNNQGDMVAYCFAPVAGYSSFGSYTGNGSTDGPFVYTGHRSRFLLIKCSSLGGSGQNWIIIDTSRDTYNISENILRPNLSDAEADYGFVDVLSNGFKLKNTDNSVNGSGQTYVYMALAEHPFAYARAR
jgi:hypothetical protein